MTKSETPDSTEGKKKSRKRLNWLALIVFVVALIPVMIFTNPDKDHFRRWLNYHLYKPGGSLFEKVGRISARRQLNYNITYLNRGIFSISQTKIGTKELTFIGLFGTWLPLN